MAFFTVLGILFGIIFTGIAAVYVPRCSTGILLSILVCFHSPLWLVLTIPITLAIAWIDKNALTT